MPKDISRRHIFLPITFFWVFFGLASVQPFVVPYLREDAGMSETRAVTVLASVYLILGVCRFFTSRVIRFLGKKTTILLGVCGYILFPVILLFGTGFAWGTLIANVLGCFLLGFLMHVCLVSDKISDTLRMAMTVGFLGALTTFSTFSYETVGYIEDGSWTLAIGNIAANLIIGLGATLGGLILARTLFGGTT